ncbi:MAG: FkbM family methyltransferase [Actinomycetota bacterium]
MIRALGRLAATARGHGLGAPLRVVRDTLDRLFIAIGWTPLRVSVDGFVLGGFLRHRSFLAGLDDGYEPFLRELFDDAAATADLIMDVGSHTGLYALVASRTSPDLRVIAIEADPYNSAALRRNVRGTGVEVVAKAVSDRVGRSTFRQNLGTIGSSLVERPGTGPLRMLEVETTTIDTIAADARSIVLKLDVEGAEIPALAGAVDTIRRAERATLFVELNPRALAAAGSTGADLVRVLRELELDVWFIDESRRALIKPLDLQRKGNLLARKRA